MEAFLLLLDCFSFLSLTGLAVFAVVVVAAVVEVVVVAAVGTRERETQCETRSCVSIWEWVAD